MAERAPGANGFGFSSTAEDVTEGVSLAGKTMLVTGCNSGIGKETIRVLALRGAHIVGAARTLEKAQAAFSELGLGEDMATPVACELSDLDSVRAAVDAVKAGGRKLDALVCNAGIMALPELQQKNGVELQLYTNHVGHFVLVTGLLEQLSDDGRVVVVSSGAHRMAPQAGIEFDNLSGEKSYHPWAAYGQSKIANILFARALSKRFAEDGRTANACHPGVIKTNLARHIEDAKGLFASMDPNNIKTIPQGAATQVYLAAHPDGASVSGRYFSDCNEAEAKAVAYDDALAEKLWTWSEQQ